MKEQLSVKSIKISNEVLLGSVIEFIKSGKQVKINVVGSSMQPFLFDGDTIILRGIVFDSIRLGDILLGKYLGKYVLHRVVRIGEGCVYLAGDKNLIQIEMVKLEEIYAIAATLLKDNRKIDLTNRIGRFKGLGWFYFRPIRRVFAYIFNK